MKYGLITYKDIPSGRDNVVDDKGLFNVGDNIQMLALKRIYLEEMHLSEDDIIEIDFHSLNTYLGEYVVLPINLFFMGCHDLKSRWFPASSHIIPVFIGVHFSCKFLTSDEIEYLKMYSPIGCRDEYTLQTMRKYGIRSYLAGCVTATLPLRKKDLNQKTIFLVDVDEKKIREFIPDYLKDNIRIVNHVKSGAFSKEMYNNMDKEAADLLSTYRDEAKLVITSRLHCASPCIAMGIPTIMIVKEISSRFSWLNSLIPIYKEDECMNIDWNIKAKEYEDIKKQMIKIIVSRIQKCYDYWKDFYDLSAFFEQKKDFKVINPYDFYFKTLADILLNSSTIQGYYLWGGTSLAEETSIFIGEKFPEIQFLGLIDEYNTVKLNGKKSVSFDSIKPLKCCKDILLICTPSSSKEFIKNKILSSCPIAGTAIFFDGEVLRLNFDTIQKNGGGYSITYELILIFRPVHYFNKHIVANNQKVAA